MPSRLPELRAFSVHVCVSADAGVSLDFVSRGAVSCLGELPEAEAERLLGAVRRAMKACRRAREAAAASPVGADVVGG